VVADDDGAESDDASAPRKPVKNRNKRVMTDSSDDETGGQKETREERVQGKGKEKHTSAPEKPLTKRHKPSVFSEEEEEAQYRAQGVEETVEVDVEGTEKPGSRRHVKTQQELDEEDLGEYSTK
jgi:hypothetical protein